jgi:WD40 repeat protein
MAGGPADAPYKGLQPYGEGDRRIFFGRERDVDVIAANLFAARLTVLYAASGVGKTSVLQAAVLPELRASRRVLPVVFRDWSDPGFGAALRRQLLRACEQAGHRLDVDPALPLDEFLLACASATSRSVILLFDQFEEYFLYHPPTPAETGFDAELARTVNRRELDAAVLLAMRDDGLGQLDRFLGRIPNLLGNLLRLAPLSREGAEAAIRGPLEAYNRALAPGASPMHVEDGLVRALLDDVGGGPARTADEWAWPQGGAAGRGHGEIEAPLLQLVLTRLWHEERGAGSGRLREATYRRLGGAASIARAHFAAVMARLGPRERDLAACVFRFLVSRSGAKVAQDPGDLASWCDLDERHVRSVLSQLSTGDERLLRTVAPPGQPARYELIHDALGPAILDWRAAYLQDQRRMASSRELAASALGRLATEPELGLLLAVEAAGEFPTVEARAALREALHESRVRHVLRGHDGPVNGAAFSPDGTRLVTAGADGTARLWDTATWSEVLALRGHQGEVWRAAFSPDGALLVTAGEDGTARLWEADGGRPAGELRGHAGRVGGAAFRADGRLLATAGHDQLVRLWEPAPTGWRVAAELHGHKGEVYDVAFSPDGALLASAGADETARIVALDHHETVAVLSGHLGEVWSVAFSPDARWLATASFDGTVRIWAAGPEGSGSRQLGGHSESVRAAAFSPDGQQVLSASFDGTARVWEVATGLPSAELRGHAGRVTAAAYAPGGGLAVTAGADGTARVWATGSERSVLELRGHQGGVNCAAYSPDGALLLTGSGDETARLWDAAGGEPKAVLRGHRGDIWNASFSADGRRGGTGSTDGTARIWDLRSHQTVLELAGHDGPVTGVAFSPDGAWLVTASFDGAVRLWDPAGGALRRVLREPGMGQVHNLAFGLASGRLVTSSFDGAVRVWDLAGGGSTSVLRRRGDWAGSAAFSPDERYLVTTGWEATALVWDADRWEVVAELRGHLARVRGAAFSADGRWLVTCSGDRTARVWEAGSWRMVNELKGHLAPVSDAGFSPDGEWVVTACHDRIVRVFAREDGASVEQLLALARTRATRALSPQERAEYLHQPAAR